MLLGYDFFFFNLTPDGVTKHQFAQFRHSRLASMREKLQHDTWTTKLKPGLVCHYKFNRRNLAIWSKSQQPKFSLFPTECQFPNLFCQHYQPSRGFRELPELRSACDLISRLVFQSDQPFSVVHWWSHVCEDSPRVKKCHQKKGNLDRDQLKPLLGNISLALEVVLLCVTYSLGQDSVAQKWMRNLFFILHRPAWYFLPSADQSGHLGLSHGQRGGTPGSICSLARQRQPLDWVSHSPTVSKTKSSPPLPNLPLWVVPLPQILTPLVLRESHWLLALSQRLRWHFPNNVKEGRKEEK